MLLNQFLKFIKNNYGIQDVLIRLLEFASNIIIFDTRNRNVNNSITKSENTYTE